MTQRLAHTHSNAGCSWAESSEQSYGEAFNKAGGGVFATFLTEDGIESYFWSRKDVPGNIDTPDKATWGQPTAFWPKETCSMSWFGDQTMVSNMRSQVVTSR